MTKPPVVWEENHTVDTVASDWTGVATIQFVCRAMQETAWRHATSIGFGVDHMLKTGIVWILTRQQLRIEALPEWTDTITVRTWYADRDRLQFYRDFEILDTDSRVLVSASTAWIGLDIRRKRPVRADRIAHGAPTDRRRAVSDPWVPFPEMTDPRKGDPFRVFARDLDMSGHANNVNYPEWLLEPLALDFRAGHNLKALDIAFQAEAVHRDELVPVFQATGGSAFAHQLSRPADGKAICTARSIWHQRDEPRPTGWSMANE
jgi:medium-chain acyl-[acyl-carrier-protein] hydrolase